MLHRRGNQRLVLAMLVLLALQNVLLWIEGAYPTLLFPAIASLLAIYGFLFTRFYTQALRVMVIVFWLMGPFAGLLMQGNISAMGLVVLIEFPLMALMIVQIAFDLRVTVTLLLLTFVVLLLLSLYGNPIVDRVFSAGAALGFCIVALINASLNHIHHSARGVSESARRENAERYRIVTEMVSDFVFKVRLGKDGAFFSEWTAGAVEQVIGYAPLDSAGQAIPLLDIIVPEDMGQVMQALAGLADGGTAMVEIRVRKRAGEIRWLRMHLRGEVSPVTGSLAVIYGAAKDITESRRAMTALVESEKRLQAITDANVMGIVIISESDSVVRYANPIAIRMLGYDPQRFVGQIATEEVVPEAVRVHLLEMLQQTDFIQDHEMQVVRQDRTTMWISISIARTHIDGESVLLCNFVDTSTRKATEQALLEQQQRYEALVNSVDGVVWVVWADTLEKAFISRQIEDLTGYSQQRFYDERGLWTSLIHPDDREHVARTRDEHVASGQGYQIEYRIRNVSGELVWVRDSVSVGADSTGRMLLRVLSINITGWKQAQLAEEQQRRFNDALRDTVAFISSTLDLDEVLDRILEQLAIIVPSDASDVMLIRRDGARIVRARGYQSSAMRSRITDMPFPIEEMPTFQRMIATGQPMIINDVQSSPDWWPLDAMSWIRSAISAPIRLEGETIGFINLISERTGAFSEFQANALCSFADQASIAIRNARLFEQINNYADLLEAQVTQRTAELELERERAAAMLDSTGDGIFYTEDNALGYVNAALCAMTGYSEAELIGRPVSVLRALSELAADGQIADGLTQVLRAEGLWRGEVEVKRRDGSTFFAGLTASRIGGGELAPLRAVTVMRDISKEKKLQQQQSNLVAFASHELRTPITNLKTRLYLLRRRPEQLETHLTVLEQVTERMKRLVEDLLDISRMESGVVRLHRQRLDLDALLVHLVETQRPEAEHASLCLTYTPCPQPVLIDADSERLTQVLTNLLTNAIRYTPAGGEVHVSTVMHEPGKVAVQVADSGIGIAPEHIAHIFQPFFRVASSVEGTGLGLSIARQIVEMHGGEMRVSSAPGKGSTFSVILDCAPPAAVRETP